MPDHHYTGVMVAFFLRPDEANVLAVEGGVEPERLHLTLAYIGDTEELNLDNLDKLPAAVADWAEAQEPITGHVGGIGMFSKREDDGTQAFYASFDSPEIQAFRSDLVHHLGAHGFTVADDHGFTPHVTLAYVSDGQPPVSDVDPLELGFEEVSVCLGDERYDYSLAGHAQEVIRKEGDKWFLYSKDGSRRLGGPYDSREDAEDREKQVQYFKRKEEADPDPEPEPEPDPDLYEEAQKFSLIERALLGRSLEYGPMDLTETGRAKAHGLVDQGLAFWTDQDQLDLTVSGLRLASRIKEHLRGVEMPGNIVAGERIKWEFKSEVWPVHEAEGGELTGKAWDVTLIGAATPGEVVRRGGTEYVRSKNGRLYSCEALKTSAPQWNGVKVYDNHLTDAEFESRQGMRSVMKEWVGTVVKPYWDESRRQLRGVLKVVESGLAQKLLEAHRQGVLSTIGLSIDTLPTMKGGFHEGQPMQFIDGFQKIFSVDLVAEPAAGGGFNRLIASMTDQDQDQDSPEDRIIEPGGNLIEWIQSDREGARDAIKAMVREALVGNGSGTVRGRMDGTFIRRVTKAQNDAEQARRELQTLQSLAHRSQDASAQGVGSYLAEAEEHYFRAVQALKHAIQAAEAV